MNHRLIIHYGAEMQEKKPLPQFREEWKECFIHVAIKIIEKLSGQAASICIKQEALEGFPDFEKPIIVWDNSKKHWMAMNPKKEESKIATPSKRIIDPSAN